MGKELITECIQERRNKTDKTKLNISSCLDLFFDWLEGKTISKRTILAYLDHLDKHEYKINGTGETKKYSALSKYQHTSVLRSRHRTTYSQVSNQCLDFQGHYQQLKINF